MTDMSEKKSLLVVDDEEIIHLSIDKIFRDSTFRIHHADNAADALEICLERKIDLVLSDIRMPITNGIELLKNLKEMRPTIAVIIMTGFASRESVADSVALDAHCYLAKPFDDPSRLREEVNKALKLGETSD